MKYGIKVDSEGFVLLTIRVQNGAHNHLTQFYSAEIIQYINNLERRYSYANRSRLSKESSINRRT
jgi:hypothetical protein